ncbi:hypothetical protein [uncultured Alistipes sp.]|uniref:hypothetical protein n=1 Tax=uncultured Alistipes sp. TaxID=538949 RepID=UPI002585C25C|nr:hypothetical protein [uncultured Alistipes sp.]
MIQRSSLASRICGTAALVLLTCYAARLHAAAPGAAASGTSGSAAACTPAEERGRTTEEQARRPAMQVRTTGEQRRTTEVQAPTTEVQAPTTEVQTRTAEAPLRTAPSDDRSKRARHLAPRGRSQHTFFANAGYTAILSTIYLRESSSGSLNEGLEITAGYNWTSRRGLGVGVVYSGGFISAQRGGFERTSRIHYIAPEFVARQRVGRRWLFRESAGIGYGRYIRSYAGLTGSRGGVGIHESVSAEFMLTRFLGLGVTVGGQWLIVDSPDVDDGAELNLAGIFRVQLGGGIRFYF